LPAAPWPISNRHQVQPCRGRRYAKGKGAEFFKQKAEELTKGRVKVEVYPNSTLYKDKEELEALQLGAVQMLAPSLAKFGPLGVKEFELFDLPFIFDNYEELHKVTTGPVGKSLLKKLEAKGILGLAYWDNGFKVMSANKPLRMPEDFKGLKMRIQSSNVLDAQMRALGALPQKMLFPRSTRRCRPAWSMAPRIRPRTSIRRRCTRCRNT
jgi:C4-dicarboxylate-binding protein DctP